MRTGRRIASLDELSTRSAVRQGISPGEPSTAGQLVSSRESVRTGAQVRRFCTMLLLGSLAFSLAACTSEKPSPFKRVTGEVTYKGAPVADALISLVPRGASGRSATATTSSSGKFQLGTINPGDGALPGDYDVTIQKIETPDSPYAQVMTDFEEQKLAGQGKSAMPPISKPKHLLPVKYSKPQTSGLTATVEAEKPNELKFELVD